MQQNTKQPRTFKELEFAENMDTAFRTANAIVRTVMSALEHDPDHAHLFTALVVAQDALDQGKERLDEWDQKSRKPRAKAEQARTDAERAAQPTPPMTLQQIANLEALIAESKQANKAAAKAKGGRKH